ncbi:MAG TPA: PTS sugar transporter subunit IIA [Thermoguttaceae bacterium]|nr:PTS sugar transporter subunit IIA [Thermoguttaceae bacterium]
MTSSRIFEESSHPCPVCGNPLGAASAAEMSDVPCPYCGNLLQFAEKVLGEEIRSLVRESIIPKLKATTKEEAVREIVAQLASVEAIPTADEEDVVQAILKREELGSTGIGGGIAVPHAVHSSVDGLVGTTAFSPNGVDFNSPDGKPVHRLFLFLIPVNRPSEHLRAMQQISRHISES